VKSAGANPAGKVAAIVAGMAAGADSIDDLQLIRSGGMARLFGGVYAPATLGQFLRSFTHGHTQQLASVRRAHLVNLVGESPLLPGLTERALVDIDSLLRPVYGRAKQGASFGHTKVAGRTVLRRGLSPLAATVSTPAGAPVLTGIGCGPDGPAPARGRRRWCARRSAPPGPPAPPGTSWSAATPPTAAPPVVAACLAEGAQFSLVLVKNGPVNRAIAAIPTDAWTPVHYPGAVHDPDTGALISAAEVAETGFTAFAATRAPVTARLVVRRVRDANSQDPLLPLWRYHPFFTNSAEGTVAADLTHRAHAIVETVFADLIDGPLAHCPSGSFAANQAWAICAAITHNLLRAAGAIAGPGYAVARGATLRRHIVNVPARLARPQRKAALHLPEHWPWTASWTRLWDNVFPAAAT
jgi:hypothetical protein